jgi:K+-transporting ATPase ATPase C chain
MTYIAQSLRLWAATFLVCVVAYAALILGMGQALAPAKAQGSLIERGGVTVGSALIAQPFSEPRYFWPRPSAADYDGMGSAGSNLSPTSDDLRARASETVARYGADLDRPLPADLVAASGGGLDPHISLAGALYQVPRVAAARAMSAPDVEALVRGNAETPGAVFAPAPIVNVLLLNMALDALEE